MSGYWETANGKKHLFFQNKEKIMRMKQQTDLSRKTVSQKRTSSYASMALDRSSRLKLGSNQFLCAG